MVHFKHSMPARCGRSPTILPSWPSQACPFVDAEATIVVIVVVIEDVPEVKTTDQGCAPALYEPPTPSIALPAIEGRYGRAGPDQFVGEEILI